MGCLKLSQLENDFEPEFSFVENQNDDENSAVNFYPYGLTMNSYSNVTNDISKYKYQGKERDQETGYDNFGARFYDNALARFMQVDPLTELLEHTTPFQAMGNNPTLRIDPDGKLDIINPYNQVVSNQKLITALEKFNDYIAEFSGLHSSEFTIKITGGDRYYDYSDPKSTTTVTTFLVNKNEDVETGTITEPKVKSKSNGKWIENSHPLTDHAQENGARGIDVQISENISQDVIKKAIKAAGLRITPEKAYKDGHRHIKLPRSKKNNSKFSKGKNYRPKFQRTSKYPSHTPFSDDLNGWNSSYIPASGFGYQARWSGDDGMRNK